MLKRLLNEAKIKLDLEVPGPIAVKDASGKELVLTQYRGNETFYLPGTSLRGVVRSHAEKLTRTFAADDRCCDPFGQTSCSKRLQKVKGTLKKDLPGEQVHAFCCAICRLFGSLSASSRIQFHDFLATSGNKTTRHNVAIDRKSGAVAQGPFPYDVIVDGRFEGEIMLRNFELWHLGLLGVVLRELEEGVVKVGFGKGKGLGAVKPTIQELSLSYIGSFNDAGALINYRGETVGPLGGDESEIILYGVGKIMGEDGKPYLFVGHDDTREDILRTGLATDDSTAEEKEVPSLIRRTLRFREEEKLRDLFTKLASRWLDYLHQDFQRQELVLQTGP